MKNAVVSSDVVEGEAKGMSEVVEGGEAARDEGHEGWTLKRFWEEQSGKGTEHQLTMAEVAVLRLYTGPMFRPWNAWARHGNRGKGDWSTSVAVLYNALIKLSHTATPSLVYRGVVEDSAQLPAGCGEI